jgi:squalene synthase HpnC
MIPTAETIASFYKIPSRPAGVSWTVEEAYEYCRDLTVSHYENFPVGSILIPKHLRPHVHAIYAFSRVADDFADEPQYEGRRIPLLNAWNETLIDAYAGKANHPIFLALADTVERQELPISLFQGLLRAFKQDVTVKRYETLEDVIHQYCQFSANPVGRLILHLFGYRDAELFTCSDHICTALQLTNFWQDITIDQKKDRVYIPQKMMKMEEYTVDELFAHVYDERFLRIMRLLGIQTWELFDRGYPLLDRVAWPLSSELRFTWLGGAAILARLAKNGYNVFHHRPKLSKLDFLRFGFRSFGRIAGRRQKLRRLFEMK